MGISVAGHALVHCPLAYNNKGKQSHEEKEGNNHYKRKKNPIPFAPLAIPTYYPPYGKAKQSALPSLANIVYLLERVMRIMTCSTSIFYCYYCCCCCLFLRWENHTLNAKTETNLIKPDAKCHYFICLESKLNENFSNESLKYGLACESCKH